MADPTPSAPYLSDQGSSQQLSRTSSLPSGINSPDSSVQLRSNLPSRGQKKAQQWRSSVAVMNSDYYSQWRPQTASSFPLLARPRVSPLVRSLGSGVGAGHGGGGGGGPSLDTISEYDIELQERRPASAREHMADPNMFRYTPVMPPFSRPTTPQIGSGAGFAPIRPASVMSQHSTSAGAGATAPVNIDFLRESSQAIHISAAATNQFLPLFLNPETGNVYMFEDSYYIPIPSRSVKELEKGTTANALTKVPTPDRRSVALPTPPPDCFKFVVAMTVLSFLCLNIPVILIFFIPSLLCSYKIRMFNSLGDVDRARTFHEWTLCSAISGIIFTVLTAVISVVVMILVVLYLEDII